jgi:hypothetical protein
VEKAPNTLTDAYCPFELSRPCRATHQDQILPVIGDIRSRPTHDLRNRLGIMIIAISVPASCQDGDRDLLFRPSRFGQLQWKGIPMGFQYLIATTAIWASRFHSSRPLNGRRCSWSFPRRSYFADIYVKLFWVLEHNVRQILLKLVTPTRIKTLGKRMKLQK